MGGGEGMTGTLYGLGLGPGDPELLTLKAVRLLGAVPVIAYLAPDDGDSLARSIAAPHLAQNHDEISIAMPMRADPTPGRAAYDIGADAIATHLQAGRDVAFLCEGDPFLYGSFMYLFQRLVGRFEVVTVPGVSSLGAAAAQAGMPLVSRNETLAVVPATLDETTLIRRLADADAVCVLKGGRQLDKVRRVLTATGLADNAQVVVRATFEDGHVVPLAEAGDTTPYFSLVLARRDKEIP